MSGALNLADLFESVVDVVGDREAVVTRDRRLTYSELDARANRVSHLLRSIGVGPGDRIGLALANGHEHVEGLLGAYKLRAVPFNVNYRYTAPELSYLFADARPAAVLYGAELGPAIDAALAATDDAGRITPLLGEGPEHEARLALQPSERPVVEGRSGDDEYLIYTGGTTGMPKGVEWRHHDIYFAALRAGADVGSPVEDPALTSVDSASPVTATVASSIRALPASPMVHGTAQWVTLATLLSGGAVVTLTSSTFVAEDLWDLAEAEAATMIVIVGDAFARPLADTLADHPDRWEMDSLSALVSGGAPLSPSVRGDLARLLPWATIVDGYGTSETGGQGNSVTWPGQEPRPATGFPLSIHTAVLDEDGCPFVPRVHAGRIGVIARTGHIPRGYRNDPERTAQTFPTIGGRRWAVPGDLGRVEADGTVTLLGRGGSSINTGGEKVYPDEVEAVLKEHPAVFDAAVIGLPDTRWGELVVAVVAVRDQVRVGDGDLESHCRDRLAPFKVPRGMVLVDAIRRLPNGKPDQGWVRAAATRELAPPSGRQLAR